MKETYKKAMQTWMLLICAARERKIYTYSDIGKILKVSPRTVGKYLDPIMRYCEDKKYPPLDVLVVRKDTGLPGNGYVPRKTVDQDMADVYEYKHKWFSVEPPQISDFENAIKNKKS